jgi:ubiquinone/menaquinone biosynthesis C-methylase UbiE
MIPSLHIRHREPEWMDADDVDAALLGDSLAFIRRVNVALGYTRATLHHLEQFSHRWRPGERVTILDVATGSADVPVAILRWGRRRGLDVRVIGVDRHAATVAAAARAARGWGERLRLVRADALALPFDDGSVDYAITSMFLHHLSDAEATAVLRGMGRVARRGIIAADLLRHRRAYAWVSLLTVLSNPMVRHDARASVRQAFNREEVLRMRDEAGVGFATYHRHFGHRFVLAGERVEKPE